MKLSSKTKATLETILVIGLILIIPLFFAINSGANPPDTQAEISSIPPTVAVNAPEDSDAVKPQQPPACTFPLAEITVEESTPEDYTFSEPQVVLTAPKGNIYHIAEWLPDNQQILMTEEIGDGSDRLESIALYNPVTGDSKVYATRPVTQQSPAWQPELNAVVYPVMRYFDIDTKNRTYKFSRELWISYGNPETARMLSDNPSQLPFAIKPGGSDMLYLSDKEISKLDKSLKKSSSTPFDFMQWDYAKERRSDEPISYNMAWQPGTSLIFLYSEGAMQGGGYTFILNAETGQVCELDLGGWARVAHWSFGGRYLAFIGVKEYAFLYSKSDLTLLDTVTGHLITLNVTPHEIENQHYIDDFVWAPDDRHLLALGSTFPSQSSETGDSLKKLYLIDFVSGKSVDIIPEYTFYTNSPKSMVWSPDGSKLVMRCPAIGVDRVCFISVQRTGQ